MTNFIRILWFGLAALFFLIWLWSKLETVGKKTKRSDSADLLRQCLFVMISVILSFLIDIYVLPSVAPTTNEYVPLWVLEALLLPIVFLGLGKIIGPSKDIRITQAPRLEATRRNASAKKGKR